MGPAHQRPGGDPRVRRLPGGQVAEPQVAQHAAGVCARVLRQRQPLQHQQHDDCGRARGHHLEAGHHL